MGLREVSDRGFSACEEPEVGCVQVAVIKSPKRLQSPALESKTQGWVSERVLPTEMCGCILVGLSPASVSTEDRTRQLWSCHACPHPCHENLDKTRVHCHRWPRPIHTHPWLAAGCPISAVRSSGLWCSEKHLQPAEVQGQGQRTAFKLME